MVTRKDQALGFSFEFQFSNFLFPIMIIVICISDWLKLKLSSKCKITINGKDKIATNSQQNGYHGKRRKIV